MITLPTAETQSHEVDTAPPRRFLTPLAEPGHFLLILDNSALERWKRCPMAARNYLVLGRDGHARNAALTYGGVNHVGLEMTLRQQFDPTVTDEDVVAAMVKYWTDNPTPPDEWRTLSHAVEVLAHYRDRAKLPDYEMEVLVDEYGPIIERPFELPLGVIDVGDYIYIPNANLEGQKVLVTQEDNYDTTVKVFVSHVHVAWSGRIDLLTRCGPGGRVRVVDHKTSSIDGDQFVQSFQLSSQTLGYCWAAREMWPEHSVLGFCLNVLRLKRPGKDQPLTAKGARGGEAPLAFFRAYFDYSAERLAQWKVDTMNHISDLLHCLTRSAWPLNDRHCFDKFGRCPYFDACSIDDVAVRERFLQSEAFKTVTWNPTRDR